MKIHTKIGVTAMVIAISTAADAAFISGNAYCRDSAVVHDFDGSVTASLVKAADGKTRVLHRGLDGLDSGTDRAVVFTALWVFNPSTAAKPLGKLCSLRFNLASSFVASQKTGFHTIGGNRILLPGFARVPATRSLPTRETASGDQTSGGSSSATAKPAQVSDGGSTFVLLGTCLLGLQGIRRKLKQ